MFFSPRISTQELARLCRRLAISLEAGIDVRTVWTREADRATRPATRARMRTVSEAVRQGESLHEALSQTDDFFPEMFRELARVGEETGHLAESLAHLAEHYEEQLRLRRILISASFWPMAELGIALVVVGLFIWVMGMFDSPFNPLGLKGTSGLLVYVTFLGLVGGTLFFVFQAVRRGLVWTRPIQVLLLRLPLVRRPFEQVALSRLAWSLHLTLDTGMALRRALRLSFESTQNARYTGHIKSVTAAVEAGNPIHEALVRTGVFPDHFLEVVRVGEESGSLVESMALLSRQYREQAEVGFTALAKIGGFAIWVLVAVILIMLIFRLALGYIGMLSGAAG